MAPQTVEQIEDALDTSLAWRRTEIKAMQAAIADAERRSPGSPAARAFARSGVALLYAHWEGFVKEACQLYVDFVAKRRLKCAEVNDGFLRSALLALGKQALSGNEASLEALISAVRTPEKERVKIPKSTMIDTKSNLRFSVLKDILDSIGFPCEQFATRGQLIDRSLCDTRNWIAHGRYHYPPTGSFDSLQREILDMMESLRAIIVANARQRGYRYGQVVA